MALDQAIEVAQEAGANLPTLLTTVAGFASARLAQRGVYGAMRPVFGTDVGPGSLTQGEQTARIVFKAVSAVLVAGTLLAARSPYVRGFGVGLASGMLWHVANEFGINV